MTGGTTHRGRGAARLAVLAGLALAPTAACAEAGDPRIEAFAATCLPDRQDFEASKARAVAEGWSPATGAEHPEFAALLRQVRDVAIDPGMTSALETYRKAVGGREAYLVVASLTSEHIDLVSCYLYDFDATAPLPQEPFDTLLGEAPYQKVDMPGDQVARIWDTPENLPGTWDVYVGYAHEGGTTAKAVKFSGTAIRITSVDPKEK